MRTSRPPSVRSCSSRFACCQSAVWYVIRLSTSVPVSPCATGAGNVAEIVDAPSFHGSATPEAICTSEMSVNASAGRASSCTATGASPRVMLGGASLDEDLRRVDSILSVLKDGQKLCVDANGRFVLDTAIAYAKALSQYDLFWYEEPGDPLDFELQATLRNYYKNPMATGEDLFSMQDARNLIRYGGMRPDRDYLQFDCALSYGLVEYLRTLEMLKEHGWSPSRCIPHGGHQMSLNIAAGLGLGGNESYPDLFQPFGGFPDGVNVVNSYVTLPDLPGIGFEGKADLYREMKALSD